MEKVIIFDIKTKKRDQLEMEMRMTPKARLMLCLDLMDLAIAISTNNCLQSNPDDIEWIELTLKNAKPGT